MCWPDGAQMSCGAPPTETGDGPPSLRHHGGHHAGSYHQQAASHHRPRRDEASVVRRFRDRHRQRPDDGVTAMTAAAPPLVTRPFTVAIDRLLCDERRRVSESTCSPLGSPTMCSTERSDAPPPPSTATAHHYAGLTAGEREMRAQKAALLEEQRVLRAALAAHEQALRPVTQEHAMRPATVAHEHTLRPVTQEHAMRPATGAHEHTLRPVTQEHTMRPATGAHDASQYVSTEWPHSFVLCEDKQKLTGMENKFAFFRSVSVKYLSMCCEL